MVCFFLSNKPQPDKYNIFIYHHLTVIFVALKRGLTPKIGTFHTVLLNISYSAIKLTFFLNIYVFGVC